MAQRSARHEIIDDPGRADLILIVATFTLFFSHVDRSRQSIRRHPFRVKHREKCFVYDIDDHPSPFVPGVFASLDKRLHDPSRQRAGPFVHQLGNHALEPRKPVTEAPWLCSFVGAVTHSVRERILSLEGTRLRIIKTSGKWPDDRATRDEFKRQYVDSIHGSMFVLCPRGRGTSSVRLYEVMQAGRVPVIISDDWVPPNGPDWENCSIRVPERSVREIPRLLERMEPRAAEMATAAREAFDKWFSEAGAMAGIIDSCLDLQRNSDRNRAMSAWKMARHLSRPEAVRHFVLAPAVDWFRNRLKGSGARSVARAVDGSH